MNRPIATLVLAGALALTYQCVSAKPSHGPVVLTRDGVQYIHGFHARIEHVESSIGHPDGDKVQFVVLTVTSVSGTSCETAAPVRLMYQSKYQPGGAALPTTALAKGQTIEADVTRPVLDAQHRLKPQAQDAYYIEHVRILTLGQ